MKLFVWLHCHNMLNRIQNPELWKVVKIIAIVCWLLMALISLDHLFPVCSFCAGLPTFALGILSWMTFILTIVLLGRNCLPFLFLLVTAFMVLGFFLGPFLEPPADPLEHLRRVNELTCGKTASDMPQKNRGLWHYSMVGNLLCSDNESIDPEKRLRSIDLVNGLFWGLAVACLHILSLRAGLPCKWAFLSVLICFLFFGTNRFSYFRYYSLAPCFSSLMICWLWTAVFFFKKTLWQTFAGITAALICLPILWVNHNQEAVFLGFIACIWLIINIFSWLYHLNTKNSVLPLFQTVFLARKVKVRHVLSIALAILIIILWIVPQSELFRKWLSQYFLRDFIRYYNKLAFFWHDVYIGGRISNLRVTDTLGIEGMILAGIALPYLWPGFLRGSFERKMRIFILGTLPFIGYFIPLFHFIWAANVKMAEYYRLCYISMYWIVFADFLFRLEERVGRIFSILLHVNKQK